ncbi:energy transducer TonB [Methylolobus aquaticus]
MIDAARRPAPERGWWPLPVALLLAMAVNVAVLLMIDGLVARRDGLTTALTPPVPIRFVTQSTVTETETDDAAGNKTPDAAPASNSAPTRHAPAPAAPKPRTAKPLPPVKSPAAEKPVPKPKPRPAIAHAAVEPELTVPSYPAVAPPGGTGSVQSSAAASGSAARGETRTYGHGVAQSQGAGTSTGSGGGGGHSGVVVLSRVMPRYPPRAERQGLEGSVTLELTINAAGVVSQAAVVAAQPPGVFDEAALEAIRQWRFKPAYRSGRAVEQRARQRISFRLPRR